MIKKTKISDIITIVLFLALLVGFSAMFVALPDVKELELEGGRPFQQLPSFSEGYTDMATGTTYEGTDYLFHGKLANDFDEYFCDQFPLRTMFLGLKALTEDAFGRNLNGGVLREGDDLATIQFEAAGMKGKTEYFSADHVKKGITNLNTVCEGLDAPATVLLPPRSIDVKAETMGYPTDLSDSLNNTVKGCISDEYYLDLFGTMRSLYKSDGGEVYFRTDHHWTVKGAYYAYAALMEEWGVTPYAMEDFEFVTVSEDFKGTSLRNGNYYYMEGDKLQLARYEGDEDFTVSLLNVILSPDVELDGLYDFSALDTVDAYSIFLHGKPMHMSITKEGEDRETLLVIKDSFGHSLIPFLARHYDIFLMDLDTSMKVTSTMSSFVKKFGADRVLFVYNMQNVIETDRLSLLKP